MSDAEVVRGFITDGYVRDSESFRHGVDPKLCRVVCGEVCKMPTGTALAYDALARIEEALTDAENLAAVPEGFLWLRLFEYARAVASELNTTPTAWMHTQVDIWAQADRSAARDRLSIVATLEGGDAK